MYVTLYFSSAFSHSTALAQGMVVSNIVTQYVHYTMTFMHNSLAVCLFLA